MIDTVILTIPDGNYHITDWDKFPNLNQTFNSGFSKIVNNPTPAQNSLSYFPRLTLQKRMSLAGFINELKVEFSAPAIIHNHNFYEVGAENFEEIVDLLFQKMCLMGVIVSKETIRNASVQTFHPSKNILLSNGDTATMVIQALGKIDLLQRFDLEAIKFRNGGTSLQYYSRALSVVFYDKVSDLGKTVGRGKNNAPNELFGNIQKLRRNRYVEVLKMEVRMTKKKMNDTLKKLGFSKNPTFENIFKSNCCQKILQHYWKEIIEKRGNGFLLLPKTNNLEEDFRFILNSSSIPSKKALYLAGLKFFIEKNGSRHLKNILKEKRGKNGLARFSTDLKNLDTIFSKKKTRGNYSKDIVSALENPIPFSKSMFFTLSKARYVPEIICQDTS